MTITETPLAGLLIIEPKIWRDDRGHFFESFNKKNFADAGITDEFVQDNQSLSQRGTVRGLHAQAAPFAQGKLVRVIRGRVLDVAVDARKSSPTFGQHFGIELSADNFKQLWIPPGFLHGFATLDDNTIFTYKVTGLYHKESEIGAVWSDPALGIDWGIPAAEVQLSEKDRVLPLFNTMERTFD